MEVLSGNGWARASLHQGGLGAPRPLIIAAGSQEHSMRLRHFPRTGNDDEFSEEHVCAQFIMRNPRDSATPSRRVSDDHGRVDQPPISHSPLPAGRPSHANFLRRIEAGKSGGQPLVAQASAWCFSSNHQCKGKTHRLTGRHAHHTSLALY